MTSKTLSETADIRKTEAFIKAGYKVLRVREIHNSTKEEKLLSYEHPKFYQISYEYSRDESKLKQLAERIVRCLEC